MVDYILNFGVPLEVNIGAYESRHKPTKITAKLTQKNEEMFDWQTAIQLEELHLPYMAILEYEGNPMLNYSKHGLQPQLKDSPLLENLPIEGAKLTVFFDNNMQELVVTMN